MSEEAVIAKKSPFAVELVQGESYYWCACGRSKNQPFCDGSHVGTNFTPVAFTPEARLWPGFHFQARLYRQGGYVTEGICDAGC